MKAEEAVISFHTPATMQGSVRDPSAGDDRQEMII
jgi:hypothetical protein